MSRQVRFFMLKEDEMEFLKFAEGLGDQIIDTKTNVMTSVFVLETRMEKLFIQSPRSRLVVRSTGFLDVLESEVIEFNRTWEWHPKQLRNGRLWVELAYFDELGNTVRKPEWLEDKYKAYKRWIVKNCKISKDKMYYICETALRLYKQEGFKMMGSPKYEVEFE